MAGSKWTAAFTAMLMQWLLVGCNSLNREPPDAYSTMSENYYKHVNHNYDNDPIVDNSKDVVKSNFSHFLRASCPQPEPPVLSSEPGKQVACGGMNQPALTSFECWAQRQPSSFACVNAVMTHAVDQCVAKVGAQNKFSAEANLYLGAILAVAGIGADVAAIASASEGNTATSAALAAAVAAGSANVQKVLPTPVGTSIQNMIAAGQLYATSEGLEDHQLSCLEGPGPDTCRAKDVEMKYSRLHDAVYSGYPVGAY